MVSRVETASPAGDARRPAKRWSIGALVLVGSLTCSGCAFRTHVTRMAVEHNEFVAGATNRQTIVNILRAREREPMHFTSFGQISGRVQSTGQIGVNVTANGDSMTETVTDSTVTKTGANGQLVDESITGTVARAAAQGATNFTPSASVQVVSGTDFQIAVNAGEEFYRGIMGPLSAGTIVHFLRQGYPPDLLTHLLIGRLQFEAVIKEPGPDGEVHRLNLGTIENTPDEAESANSFAAAVRCRQLSYLPRPVAENRVPVYSVSELAGLAPEVLARIRAGEIPASSYEYRTSGRTEFDLALSEPDIEQCGPIRQSLERRVDQWVAARGLTRRRPPPPRNGSGTTSPPSNDPVDPLQMALRNVSGSEAVQTQAGPAVSGGISGSGGASFSTSTYFDSRLPEGWTSELLINVTLRSVEGIIYYLGEYSRDEVTSPRLYSSACPPERPFCIPIIRVVPAGTFDPRDRLAEVEYRGQRYAVPLTGAVVSEERGRSSQVIALVQQLLNLHRSSKDLPSTPFVRVIN